ncbi:hypothetical protein ACQKND_22485 [Viridibacillus arvi]
MEEEGLNRCYMDIAHLILVDKKSFIIQSKKTRELYKVLPKGVIVD